MPLIEDFIARYRKEYDFYDQAARLVAQALEASLQAAGIRSRVTSRAKAAGRLETKARQRELSKKYTGVEEIYDDIVDLAGARVELYFPAQGPQVDTIIRGLFRVTEAAKEFPEKSTEASEVYAKRFSGYWATHYRVYLREASLSDAQKRYAEARVEIQVASVLMHAWAEVEHDLVYKPLQGELSEAEYAILDELNGLVIAGEIALERLQRAGETRVAAGERAFSNHYDLAAHLLNAAGATLRGPEANTAIGRVDLLFELLNRLGLATPTLLRPYLDALHSDTEQRPFSEQVIDQLLAEDEARYQIYEDIRARQPDSRVEARATTEPDLHEAMGFFLARWIAFERALREKIQRAPDFRNSERSFAVPYFRLLERLGLLNSDDNREVERIRRLRNQLIHGVELPSASELQDAGARIQALTKHLKEPTPPHRTGD